MSINRPQSFYIYLRHLLIVILLLTVGINTTTGNSKQFLKHSSTLSHQYNFSKKQTFIGVSHQSSSLPEELIFEERTDDDDDKLHENNFENSHTGPYVFTRTKLPLTLSAKENAYFACYPESKITIELYTLNCSWKYFLA
jgi:hypothetical protein